MKWHTEVPLADARDRRAWDAVASGRDAGGAWRVGVEAETRARDLQALERRLALKERDGAVDAVILLLADTRHHRTTLRAHLPSLESRFPASSRRALELLAAGVRPDGNAIVLL